MFHMQIYLTLRNCGSKFPKPLLMRNVSKRTCYNNGNNRKVLPVALQYMYGESNKVQNEPLKPATEYDIEGIVGKENNEGENSSTPYPFAIYDSINEAKEELENENAQPSGRRVKRRRGASGPEKSQDMDDIENLEEEGLEVKSQAEQEELFRYGSSDSSIPVSKIPCSGCGAHLHCQDSKLPGFISYEIFNGKKFKELRKIQCQRCVVMKEYNVALKMNINPEDYPKAISHLKDKKAIVVLIVDLTDFPGSIWPNILDLIGSDKRVILVGNKVDLIPQDSHGHLKKIRESMIKTFTTKCLESLDRKPIVLDSLLVSARTGFNIERLINLIFKNWRDKSEYVGGDVYLIGTTNVGKSSIFNLLMDSDLCDVKALCKIDKATIAPVPGTTLNLLKFPIMKPEHTSLSQRYTRLTADENVIKAAEKDRIANLRKYKTVNYATPCHPVGQTFWHKSDKDMSTMIRTAFEMKMTDETSIKDEKKLDFHPGQYRENKWCHDTPGTISEDQVINLFTQEEIMKILPNLPMLPRTLSVQAGLTIFIGGVARLDVLSGPEDPRWSNWPLILTLFASDELPINVVRTSEADAFYEEALSNDDLKVPSSKDEKRLADFPELKGQTMEVYGISDMESACDIVLSSIGWFSVTTRATLTYSVKAWTPGGKGVFLRDPCFLPFAVNLKGNKGRRTNFFGASRLYIP